MLFLLFVIHIFSSFRYVCAVEQSTSEIYVEQISVSGITIELNHHVQDTAIMFYSPWCFHCKELYPYWELIASSLRSSDADVLVSVFNCEQSVFHEGVFKFICFALITCY